MASISICIPTFNGNSTICDAIDSVLMCDTPPDELIVCENGASGSLESLIHDKYGSAVKFFSQPEDIGFDANVLKSISLATCDYVWLLGDDDIMHSDALRKIKKFIDKTSRPSAIVVDFKLVSRSSGHILKTTHSIQRSCFGVANLRDFAHSVAFEAFVSVFIFKRTDICAKIGSSFVDTWFVHLGLLLDLVSRGKVVLEYPSALINNCARVHGGPPKPLSFHFNVLFKYIGLIEAFSSALSGKDAVYRRLAKELCFKKLSLSIGQGYRPAFVDFLFVAKALGRYVDFWIAIIFLPWVFFSFAVKCRLKASFKALRGTC